MGCWFYDSLGEPQEEVQRSLTVTRLELAFLQLYDGGSMKEFLCCVVASGRQFLIELFAEDADDAFEKAEAMGYECYSVSENS